MEKRENRYEENDFLTIFAAHFLYYRMNLLKRVILFVAFIILACTTVSYGQVVIGSESQDSPLKIDYANPTEYEIGGITSSGTAPLDQRLIFFHVGDRIKIPGDEISKTVKNLWKTGLYDDVEITVTRVAGDVAFLDVRLEDRARLISFGFKGTTKSEENELREKLNISQGNIINDNMKTTCANIIRKYYVEKGFYSCSVNVQEIPDEKVKNAMSLLFDIQKSKKVKIAKINIGGNPTNGYLTITHTGATNETLDVRIRRVAGTGYVPWTEDIDGNLTAITVGNRETIYGNATTGKCSVVHGERCCARGKYSFAGGNTSAAWGDYA